MSITLNHSDFQCLQDQLVDLKTKNYELAEKNRRGQADFEAAKAKICSLQLKLEEQERDFQVTSSTLRREIEVAYNSSQRGSTNDEDDVDGGNNNNNDYRAKYKKLLHKAKELQQRYEKSVEVVQQMDEQIKTLSAKSERLDEENGKLKESLVDREKQIESLEKDYQGNLNSAIEEYKANATHDCQEHIASMNAIREERDILQLEVSKLQDEVKAFNARLECQLEERKIQDRKGAQMIKELKRELAQEKNRNEVIQKRLESLLSQPSVTDGHMAAATATELEKRTKLSTSSSTNGANSRGSRGGIQTNLSSSGGAGQQRDDHSVSSWSLVRDTKTTSTPSICSIESEDRETVHLPGASSTTATGNQNQHNTSTSCDTISLSSSSPKNNLATCESSGAPNSRQAKSSTSSLLLHNLNISSSSSSNEHSDLFGANKRASSSMLNYANSSDSSSAANANASAGLRFEDQAALMERVTRLQHDKWTLEEKLSYLEQANAALTQDLADKSHVIRQYFMDQATRSISHHHHPHHSYDSPTAHQLHTLSNNNNNNHHQMQTATGGDTASRRVSFPNNFNQLLADKPSLKKMVEFLKERSQVSVGGESENITREATKKMQVMLEETLIKCIKLQENLDYVTSELNKLQT